MQLKELLENLEVLSCNARVDMEITGVYNDSRKVQPGGLFVAIPGFKDDGLNYASAALEAGAAVVVSEQELPGGHPQVLVQDAREALSKIAANFYGNPARAMKIIGVTGTNGKTTVTYLVRQILESCLGERIGLIGTNEILLGDIVRSAARTTPESVELQALLAEMLGLGIRYVVMEVSSHALKLRRVSDVPYEIGIFTNLTRDHLDFHKTMEDYVESKAKLFSICKYGIINYDDDAYEKILEHATCETMSYSLSHMSADLVAANIKYKMTKVEFELLSPGGIQRVELNVPGKFSVYNALASVGAALKLGIPIGEIIAALHGFGGVKGRAEVVPTDTEYTVLIDYAHTPDAMENILNAIRSFAKGRILIVFGCGGDRDKTKRSIMGRTAEQLADYCIVTSDNPRTEDPGAIIEDILSGMERRDRRKVIPDRREAIGYAMRMAKSGDVVLLAGKGHETYQEIHGVQYPMDEREIVRSFL